MLKFKKDTKQQRRQVRHKRVRAKIQGTPQRPRLFVFKSNKHIYAGLADDVNNKVLLQLSDAKLPKTKGGSLDNAKKVGKTLASEALKQKYKKVVFDKSGYKYHGKVKALAEGAREGGLKF